MKTKLIAILISVALASIALWGINGCEDKTPILPEPIKTIILKRDTVKFDSNSYKIKELTKRVEQLEND